MYETVTGVGSGLPLMSRHPTVVAQYTAAMAGTKTRRKTQFVCRSCGGVQAKWMGKCPDCGTWDSLESFTPAPAPKESAPTGLVQLWTGDDAPQPPSATPLPQIEADDIRRQSTGIAEFDRVLGGGLVPGSVALLGGDPGIGKSTLLLQVAGCLARDHCRVLYATSEESAYQTRLRAERLIGPAVKLDALGDLLVLADTSLARIVEQARKVEPAVMIIDSIQMVYQPDLEASPGSVAQLRRCCTELVYLAKVTGLTIILVGHVTKDGQLAGPKLLEHLVDVVLSFDGDQHHGRRIVRGLKNRYGTTLEVGLFEMTGAGLEEVAEVTDVLDPDSPPRPGSVVCPAMFGTRCLLAEVQALTATGFLGAAKRRASGVDANRIAMIIAVLEKHAGLRLADQDVFASAVGGLRVVEPAADLALALAIAGAHYGRTLDAGTAAIGEIGLGGEIRPVQQLAPRLRQAGRQGYRTIVGAKQTVEPAEQGISLSSMATIGEALGLLT